MTHSVLIVGANGRLGNAAAQAFHAANWKVLRQARRPIKGNLHASHIVQAALHEVDALAREAAGVQVVVYAVNLPYTDWAAQALPAMRHAMDVAERLNACFMLPGNVYNFGANMPSLLLEDTPQQALTRKGRIRMQMESELQSRTENCKSQGRLRSIVLRAGDFYGSGGANNVRVAVVQPDHQIERVAQRLGVH